MNCKIGDVREVINAALNGVGTKKKGFNWGNVGICVYLGCDE